MATDELARRYGRPASPGRRRAAIVAAAAVLAIAVGYATWYSLTTGNPAVTWQDLGYRNTRDGVDVTFEVTFRHTGSSDAAICRVEAWNAVRTVVGTRDVPVSAGPGDERTVRVTTAIRTSEPANTGLVKACVLA